MNRSLRLVSALALLTAFGCASVRYRLPFFRRPYFPYLANPQFSCEYPFKWGDARPIHGGAEFREPRGKVSFSIVFLPQGDPSYREPERYRREMSDWGAVEDAHRVSQISISSHTAYQVRFTTYKYSPEYVLGAVPPRVVLTERIMIPDPGGIYVVTYSAEKKYFWKKAYRRYFRHFLDSLILAQPKKKRPPL